MRGGTFCPPYSYTGEKKEQIKIYTQKNFCKIWESP